MVGEGEGVGEGLGGDGDDGGEVARDGVEVVARRVVGDDDVFGDVECGGKWMCVG